MIKVKFLYGKWIDNKFITMSTSDSKFICLNKSYLRLSKNSILNRFKNISFDNNNDIEDR